MYDKNVPITPDNVLKRRIKDINSKSLFLEKSIDLVEKFSNMKCGCDNCPVQKYLKEKISCFDRVKCIWKKLLYMSLIF